MCACPLPCRHNLRDAPSGWGAASVAPMDTTLFSHLALRVGAHYLYCHQGHCEHVIVVSDIRCVCRACCLPRHGVCVCACATWSRARVSALVFMCVCACAICRRLFNPRFDNLSRSAYPLHCFQRRVDRKPCSVCSTFTAEYGSDAVLLLLLCIIALSC